MAKTKRRQLAALAAQAELKELAGHNERTTSGDKSGPSGTIPNIDDPTVEIRMQRVIIMIPPLPSKPAEDNPSPDIPKKQILGKRRKKPQIDFDFSSEQVPADETPISKVIFQFGKWKRQKKMRDLLPSRDKKVTAAVGLSNGDQVSPIAKSKVSDTHSNGHLHLPRAGFRRQSKPKVTLMTGTRKRANLQEVLVRSQGEKENKSLLTRGRFRDTTESKMDTGDNHLITSVRSSMDPLVSESNRSLESARACNGDVASTLAIAQPSWKRKRGNIRKAITQVPLRPRTTAVVHYKTRKRAKISNSEAVAVEAFQQMQHEKNITQERENFGKVTKEATLLVRSPTDGEAVNTTRNGCLTEPQNYLVISSPAVQEAEQLTSDRVTICSSSHDLVQSSPHTSFQTCLQGDTPEEEKSQLPIKEPDILFTPGEHGVLVVGPETEVSQGQPTDSFSRKNTRLWGAELIKQQNKLAVMQKRLEAAGGLRDWLLDKGLGRFVPVLEQRNFDNLSLLQLTMDDLKSMGLIPVGPRRKLIHAISSLTVPLFLKHPI